MTASLPADVQQVFERFVTTELTTVDASGQPITWPVTPYYQRGRRRDRRHDRASATRRRPTTRRATRTCRCCSPTRPAPGIESPCAVLVQGTAQRRRHEPRVEPRALLARERREAARHEEHASAGLHARLFDWYYMRLYIYVRPERVFVWPRGRLLRRSRRSTARAWRRFARSTRRSPRSRSRRPRADRPPGTTAWTSWAGATRRPCCRWSGPTGSRCPAASQIEPDRAAGRVRLGDLPEWMPRARRPGSASPRTSTIRTSSGRPTSRCAATSCARTAAGRSSRTSSSAASRSPSRKLQTYRDNFSKMMRYRKKAKAELATRGRQRAARSSRRVSG